MQAANLPQIYRLKRVQFCKARLAAYKLTFTALTGVMRKVFGSTLPETAAAAKAGCG